MWCVCDVSALSLTILLRPPIPLSSFCHILVTPCFFFFFFLMIRRPPRSPLFPYTPLFRSATCRGTPATTRRRGGARPRSSCARSILPRSEEQTSELQSHDNLGCRLLLEKKNGTWGEADADVAGCTLNGGEWCARLR